MYQRKNFWFVLGATMLFLWWLPTFTGWAIEGLKLLWHE